MTGAERLVRLLRVPAAALTLDDAAWQGVLCVAAAERLGGSLAARLAGLALPPVVARTLANHAVEAAYQARSALWEADRAAWALRGHVRRLVLLKGTAFAAAGLDAGQGRMIGDLDILVAPGELAVAEAALRRAGWEAIKTDPYDDAYYRRWMHELPPLIHTARDRIIDVHHSILPRTAGPTPDAAAMRDAAVAITGTPFYRLAPADMVVHAACHLLADGELDGGLRNLWDIDRLLRQFASAPDFAHALCLRMLRHELEGPVRQALRLAARLYHTPLPPGFDAAPRPGDALFAARMLARDDLGRGARPLLRGAFGVRGHLLRMPPGMLARHLWTKWRMARRG